MEKKFRKLIWLGLSIAAVAFLLLAYSYLPLTAPGHFNSPDENANYYFSRLFAEKQVLHFFDQPNLFSPGNVFPRSMAVVGDFTVPVGFIGAPVLFGSAGLLFGEASIPFVTPVLSVLGVFGWFLLVRRYFGKTVGLMAAGLLAVHPIWWYESARTLQPNVLFTVMVIWAAYFWLAAPLSAKFDSKLSPVADGLAGGLALGLALAVRTSEVYWIGLVFTLVAVMNRRKLPWVRMASGFFSATLAFVPFLSINMDLYGSFVRTGYGSVASLGSSAAGGGLGMKLIGPLQPYLFPLGFAPRTAAQHFWSYGLGFVPWWSVAVIGAVGWLVWLWRQRKIKVSSAGGQWFLVAAVVTVWLVVFYGSWVVRDNPDPSAVTIGSSYFRYWLPLFVLSTLPVAVVLRRLYGTWPWRRTVMTVGASAYLLAAAFTVFYSSGEGLFFVNREVRRYAAVVEDMDGILPEDAVVVTDSADKYVFPARSVVQPFRSAHARRAIVDIQRHLPVYYYGITLPAQDYRWLREKSLPADGLTIEAVKSYDHETLYRFDSLSDRSDE